MLQKFATVLPQWVEHTVEHNLNITVCSRGLTVTPYRTSVDSNRRGLQKKPKLIGSKGNQPSKKKPSRSEKNPWPQVGGFEHLQMFGPKRPLSGDFSELIAHEVDKLKDVLLASFAERFPDRTIGTAKKKTCLKGTPKKGQFGAWHL